MSTTRPNRALRRAAVGLATLLLAGTAGSAVPLAGADPLVPATASAEQSAALDWLESELTANGHGMPGFSPGAFDWGLTADAVLALAAGDRGADDEAMATTAHLLAHTSNYGTWDDLGPDYPGVRIAGALGKLLLVAEVQGIDDPADTDGFDLEAEVRSTMQTSGDQAGRFSDIDPHFGSNNANGFGQALAMLGLSYTDDGVPTQAVSFLLAQQCPGGGFRLTYAGPSCTNESASDTDTTAMAVQALLVAPRTPTVRDALVDALDWLDAKQDPTGGWGGTGPTSAVNANSSGLIAQAMRASGRTDLADDGAGYVRGVALTPTNVAGTPAAGDVGALAYNLASRDAAIASGIASQNRDQWRRSTAQAVLALDLPDYAQAAAAFYASNEYFRNAGGTNEAWLTDVYRKVLGRNPDPSGHAYWVRRTEARGRVFVAGQIYQSPESRRDRVTQLYGDLLGRGPDPSGLAFWSNRILTKGDLALAVQLASSDEYLRRARVRFP